MNTSNNTTPPKTPEQRLASPTTTAPPPAATPPPRPTGRQLSAKDRLVAAYQKQPNVAALHAAEAGSADPGHDHDDAVSDTGGDSPPPFTFEPTPEGYVLDDAETVTALSDVARELKLDNTAAQKIVDKMQPALNARAMRQVQAVVDGWEAETRADREIGGGRLDATIADARRALDAYGSPELRKLLGPLSDGGTGLGNHPEIVRFFANVGRRLAAAEREPQQPTRNLPPPSAAQRLVDAYERERRLAEPAPRPFTPSVRRPPKSAMERLTDTYRRH